MRQYVKVVKLYDFIWRILIANNIQLLHNLSNLWPPEQNSVRFLNLTIIFISLMYILKLQVFYKSAMYNAFLWEGLICLPYLIAS